jgi:hypothetical protein
MFNFEKLDLWQEAIRFADLVYELTGDFPEQERFGLTNQMRRACLYFIQSGRREVHAYRGRISAGLLKSQRGLCSRSFRKLPLRFAEE